MHQKLHNKIKCIHVHVKKIVAGRFHRMKYSGDYFVTVIEDTRINQLIGSATLVIEHKFIHDCGLV